MYCDFKLSNLVKYDMSNLKKNVLHPYFPDQAGQAEKSFNSDGYKVMRVMVFGKELIKAVINKVTLVGIVIALVDLKPMDISGQTGQSYKLDSED